MRKLVSVYEVKKMIGNGHSIEMTGTKHKAILKGVLNFMNKNDILYIQNNAISTSSVYLYIFQNQKEYSEQLKSHRPSSNFEIRFANHSKVDVDEYDNGIRMEYSDGLYLDIDVSISGFKSKELNKIIKNYSKIESLYKKAINSKDDKDIEKLNKLCGFDTKFYVKNSNGYNELDLFDYNKQKKDNEKEKKKDSLKVGDWIAASLPEDKSWVYIHYRVMEVKKDSLILWGGEKHREFEAKKPDSFIKLSPKQLSKNPIFKAYNNI